LRVARKLVVVLVLVTIVALSAAYLAFSLKPEPPKPKVEPIAGDIPVLTHVEIQNPEIAREYGIVGYLEIGLAPDVPSEIKVRRGEETSVKILLHFVSYDPNVTEALVSINPESGEGLVIEQTYGIRDTNGHIIGRGTVKINDLVSYSPNGFLTIKANQTLPVTLTIRVPKDFPSGVPPFPLGAVGITADVPIIDYMYASVTVYE